MRGSGIKYKEGRISGASVKVVLIMSGLLVLLQSYALAQVTVRGQVQDTQNEEPLAFAHISIPGQTQGTTTDIDGLFSLTVPPDARFFVVSYVGYHRDTIAIHSHKKHYTVSLERIPYSLSEVTITPGDNPAHPIIHKAVENRKHNDPHARGSYTLKTYNKLTVNIDESLWEKDTADLSRQQRHLKKELSEKHLFIMESVSQRYFLAPANTKEKVLHTRVSGLQSPQFFLLASQLQSFTFYEDFITIGGYRRLVNPISRGSTERYWFRLEDTVYINDPQDTVFIISFYQRANQSFNGMQGIVHIGARDYAIRSVIASPAARRSDQEGDNTQSGMSMTIRQNYEKVDGEKWLPMQLNLDITLQGDGLVELGGIPIKIQGHTYVQDVEVNPGLGRRFFDENYAEMDKEATIRNDSIISIYRDGRFSLRDGNTYPFIDSLSEEMDLERKLWILQVLFKGHIPLGSVNFDLNKVLHFNNYEGFRPGIGITTNERFSRVITPSAYVAYGIRDKGWKYGGALEVSLWDKHELKLAAKYNNDIREFGRLIKREATSPLDPAWYKDYSLYRFDHQKLTSLSVGFRAFRYATIETGWRTRNLNFYSNYRYQATSNEASIKINGIYTSEFFANLRYAFREQFIKTPEDKLSLGTHYPIISLHYSQGTHLLNGQLKYHKLDMRAHGSYHTRYHGAIHFNLFGGLTSPGTPLGLQYNSLGSKEGYLFSSTSFNTMGINEFAATQFLALLLEYDFYHTLFRWESMAPSFRITSGVLIGKQHKEKLHHGVTFESPNKGYLESGVIVDGLITNALAEIGVGVFFRYGPYRLSRWNDNLSVKLIIRPKF